MTKGAGDPAPAADDPAAPAHRDAGVMIDDAFWRDNLDRLSQRFEAWVAH
jgi:putative spermidine/putrescine transport system substrate-binding protein